MNQKRLILLIAFLFVVLGAQAHHSPASLYHMEQIVTVEGVVTDYLFINPHARIHFDVVNSSGEVEHWMAEGGTPNALARIFGWDGSEIAEGDQITIRGNPPRDGSNLIHWLTITFPDGRQLYGEDIDFDAIESLRRRQRTERKTSSFRED